MYTWACAVQLMASKLCRQRRVCAQACQSTAPDLFSINPELDSAVRCGDCIALPRSAAPRLLLTARGETWHSLAGALHVPPSRLRARNRGAVVRATLSARNAVGSLARSQP